MSGRRRHPAPGVHHGRACRAVGLLHAPPRLLLPHPRRATRRWTSACRRTRPSRRGTRSSRCASRITSATRPTTRAVIECFTAGTPWAKTYAPSDLRPRARAPRGAGVPRGRRRPSARRRHDGDAFADAATGARERLAGPHAGRGRGLRGRDPRVRSGRPDRRAAAAEHGQAAGPRPLRPPRRHARRPHADVLRRTRPRLAPRRRRGRRHHGGPRGRGHGRRHRRRTIPDAQAGARGGRRRRHDPALRRHLRRDGRRDLGLHAPRGPDRRRTVDGRDPAGRARPRRERRRDERAARARRPHDEDAQPERLRHRRQRHRRGRADVDRSSP